MINHRRLDVESIESKGGGRGWWGPLVTKAEIETYKFNLIKRSEVYIHSSTLYIKIKETDRIKLIV